MSNFPNSPRPLKAALILVDPGTGTPATPLVIALQYNPDSLSRSLQIKSVGEGGDHAEALRLKGPPVETIKLEAEIDAADQLEHGSDAANRATQQFGIFPQLSALETLAYPTSAQLKANNAAADSGMLEIVPMEAPLALFVWSKSRVVPVRLTELSITEEAFDPALNPIRARVSLGLRVLSVDDLGFRHKGGTGFMDYLAQKEKFAGMFVQGSLAASGDPRLPT
ncbi:conserved hypothetical protein [Rubrivivax sp. A210]|uniref:hypothetical protein n=1 Tax=Rubrivivax sp. A210 TaxID=2772301 RepID=UPI001918D5A5|nr:hypothetical protein [Rubrivivax sp. A210]CAD5367075.1 conserved hypothetical protein [Rubrivivax sp. A210]